jgi:hypothetical protein
MRAAVGCNARCARCIGDETYALISVLISVRAARLVDTSAPLAHHLVRFVEAAHPPH